MDISRGDDLHSGRHSHIRDTNPTTAAVFMATVTVFDKVVSCIAVARKSNNFKMDHYNLKAHDTFVTGTQTVHDSMLYK